MNIKKLGVCYLGAVAALLAAPAAKADITTYYSSDAFTAALGAPNVVVERFNFAPTLNPGLTITGEGVTYTSIPGIQGGSRLLWDVVDAPDKTLTFHWDKPIFALGAVWNLAGVNGPGSSITLTLADGTAETYTNFFESNMENWFKGFISTTPFMTVVLSEGTGCCQEAFTMDNMKYAHTIPEPETYALLLAGLGLMGFVARRRRSLVRLT